MLKNNKYNVTKTTTIDNKTYQAINDLVDIKGTKQNGNDDYITLGDTYQVIEAKLTINSYEIVIKNDEVISIIKIGNVVSESLLSDVVSVGDYVAYDAGTWTETKEKPEMDYDNQLATYGEFGGYTAGENKANSTEYCAYPSYSLAPLKGWRVLKADSAHIMNNEEANAIEQSNNLRAIGDSYYLASYTNYNREYLHSVLVDGEIFDEDWGLRGVRPVVILKPNIKTTGIVKDVVGQAAWGLVGHNNQK